MLKFDEDPIFEVLEGGGPSGTLMKTNDETDESSYSQMIYSSLGNFVSCYLNHTIMRNLNSKVRC
jgi:hypothetical protein